MLCRTVWNINRNHGRSVHEKALGPTPSCAPHTEAAPLSPTSSARTLQTGRARHKRTSAPAAKSCGESFAGIVDDSSQNRHDVGERRVLSVTGDTVPSSALSNPILHLGLMDWPASRISFKESIFMPCHRPTLTSLPTL